MEAYSLFHLVCSIFDLSLEFKWKTRADVASAYLEIMSLEDFDFPKCSCVRISPGWWYGLLTELMEDFISSQEVLCFLSRVCFSTRVLLVVLAR